MLQIYVIYLKSKNILTGLTESAGFGLASGGRGTGRATMGALVAAVKMNTVESLVLNESLRETEYQPEEVEMSTIFKFY